MELLVVMLAVSCLPFISTFSINNLNFEEEMPSVNEVQMVFSCEGKEEGYYADNQNDCNSFYKCSDSANTDVEKNNMYQLTFFCEAQKVFSDALGFCVPPEENVCENDPLDESQNAILDYDIENLHWRKMSL
ncbi:uncharacterized protein LOC143228136 [Tachypleus tridentatus]|uniref:uncharacterized protein LOC143228136 n=1 Tax=Tachypleus tridentatus TaxID=6853 RepID=UPI003FD3C22C